MRFLRSRPVQRNRVAGVLARRRLRSRHCLPRARPLDAGLHSHLTGVAMRPPAMPHWMTMDRDTRLKRLRFRAWHRGTKEADLMIGGFYDHCAQGWSDADIAWFEAFLEEQDVDIMAWAMKVQPIPAQWQGPMMERLCRLDFVEVQK